MKPFLYDLPILPESFQFPAGYLTAALDESLDIAPWQLLAKNMATSLYYYGAMLLKYPGATLIPFAIIQDETGYYNDGWVVLACFDAKDSRVRIFDYSNPKSSPWDNVSYSSFAEWLIAAAKESAGYKADLVDDDD